MSFANASSSSPLVAFSQDVDYTRSEGFKQFKARYNRKNTRASRNDPNAAYPSAEVVYQAVKGPGGLQAAKGGSEVGLGSVDRGGSCWW